MERLTLWHDGYHGVCHDKHCDMYTKNCQLVSARCVAVQNIIDRLAHYEDLEEQGRLIVLPTRNDYLSEQKLRLIDGEPIYLVDKEIPDNTGWVIWGKGFTEHWLDESVAGECGVKWFAYRHPPIQETESASSAATKD